MIEKRINLQKLDLIACGAEAFIYLYEGKILKDFRFGRFFNKKKLATLNNKRQKLEILKEMNFSHHPQIYDLYSARFMFKKSFYAYTIENLKNNKIKEYLNKSKKNQKQILNEIWNNTLLENKNGIYNYDLKINNLYLNQDSTLYTLDVDNMQVLNYKADLLQKLIHDFILNNKPQSQNIQNLAMLVLILEITCNWSPHSCLSVQELKDKLLWINNDKFLEKACNICDNKEEDMQELIYLATRGKK